MNESMTRYTNRIDPKLPAIAIDLGYSAKHKSCGLATSQDATTHSLTFGECIEAATAIIREKGPHTLIIQAVLSTYHQPEGNPAIRGTFEKGRGWYHGPGVTTFAAALRFLSELDYRFPTSAQPIPLVEGFLSYKPARTAHVEDARRLILEFDQAEIFEPQEGSEPISSLIQGVPQVRRYNKPTARSFVNTA